MLIFGPYAVQASSPTSITGLGGYPDTRAIIVMNESPYLLRITVNGVGIWGIPAQTADILHVGNSFSGSITIESTDYLLTSVNAPSYVVYVQTIGVQDSIFKSLQGGGVTGYPLTLPRLQSIGNAVNTNAVQSTIQNDGSPVGTNIVESTPIGASGSTILMKNDGTITFAGFAASTLTTLFQVLPGVATGVKLGSASSGVEVLQNLLVDGTLEVDGNSIILKNSAHNTSIRVDTSGNFYLKSFDNAELALGVGNVDGNVLDAFAGSSTYLKGVTGVNIQVPSGSDSVIFNGSGLKFPTGNGITWRSGDTLSVTHKFTGNGTGVYSHGCPSAPFIVLPVCTTTSSSMTVGIDSITSTQVHVTCGNAFTFSALCLVG